jgi:hypothetical protein
MILKAVVELEGPAGAKARDDERFEVDYVV